MELLQDNEFLLKSLKSLLTTETFRKMVASHGEFCNEFIASYLDYLIATREYPSTEFYERIKEAKSVKDYAVITAQCIYNNLSKQIEAVPFFKASPTSVYAHFVKNFYRNGLVFNAHRKGRQAYIDFPAKFSYLATTQPENSVVKACVYSLDKGKSLYFTPYPMMALDFANKFSGFWSVMLGDKGLEGDFQSMCKIIHTSVADLNLETENKKALYNDIVDSLYGFINADKIKICAMSRDRMDNCMACNMAGKDYGIKYGELKKYDDFDDIKKNYPNEASEIDVVLAEIARVGLCSVDFYCRDNAAKIEKIGTNVELPIYNKREISKIKDEITQKF